MARRLLTAVVVTSAYLTVPSMGGEAAAAATAGPLKLCLLVPAFDADGQYDAAGHNRLGGALSAIEEVNDQISCVPGISCLEGVPPVEYEWYDSASDALAAIRAAQLCATTAFNGTGAHAVLGPATSAGSLSAQAVLSSYGIPHLSYSATSPKLTSSDKESTFFRTVPSDAYEGRAAVDVVKRGFGWGHTLLISGADATSVAAAAAFEAAALREGLNVERSLTLAERPSFSDLNKAATALGESNARIVVLLARPLTSGLVLRQAYTRGVWGSGTGRQWILSTDLTTMAGLSVALSALTAVDPCTSCSGTPPTALSEAQAATALLGTLALRTPTPGVSATYADWAARFGARADTTGSNGALECAGGLDTVTSADSNRTRRTNAPEGSGCMCAEGTDDAGTDLWRVDHDADSSTADRCVGMAYSTGYIDYYTPFAYDGVLALARAAAAIVEPASDGGAIDAANLTAALRAVESFEGVTGTVAFTNREDSVGDREAGVSYEIVNHDGGSGASADDWVVVGLWSGGDAPTTTLAEELVVWPTADGLKPFAMGVEWQRVELGYFFSEQHDMCFGKGSASIDGAAGSAQCRWCIEGYFFDSSSVSCEPCPDNAVCIGGNALPYPKPGYWSDYANYSESPDVPGQILTIFECDFTTCKGSPEALQRCWTLAAIQNQSCDGDALLCGEGASGIVCGSCDNGYTFSNFERRCISCNDNGHVVTRVATAFFMLAAIIYVTGSRIIACAQHFHILSKDNWMVDGLVSLHNRTDVDKLKSGWVGLSIIASMPIAIEINFPEPMESLAYLFSATHLDVWTALGMGCFEKHSDLHTKALQSSVVPIVIVVVLWVMYALRRAMLCWVDTHHTRHKLQSSYNMAFQLSIVIAWLVLPNVVMIQMNSVRCTRVLGMHYLRADTSIDCDSTEHAEFLGYMVPLIVLYQLIPLTFFVLLYRIRHKINPPYARDQSAKAMKVLGVMQSDPELVPLRMLFHGYSCDYWWWDVLETYRRLVLLSFITIFDSKSNRALVGTLIGLFSCVMYNACQPFRHQSTNNIAVILQYQITITYSMALLMEGGMLPFSGVVLGMVLFLINLVVMIVSISYSIHAVKKMALVNQRLQDALDAGEVDEHEHEALPEVLEKFLPIAEVEAVHKASQSLIDLEVEFISTHMVHSQRRNDSTRTKKYLGKRSELYASLPGMSSSRLAEVEKEDETERSELFRMNSLKPSDKAVEIAEAGGDKVNGNTELEGSAPTENVNTKAKGIDTRFDNNDNAPPRDLTSPSPPATDAATTKEETPSKPPGVSSGSEARMVPPQLSHVNNGQHLDGLGNINKQPSAPPGVFPLGTKVTVFGLNNDNNLNHRSGVVKPSRSHADTPGRYTVKVSLHDDGEPEQYEKAWLSVKNLHLPPGSIVELAGLGQALSQAVTASTTEATQATQAVEATEATEATKAASTTHAKAAEETMQSEAGAAAPGELGEANEADEDAYAPKVSLDKSMNGRVGSVVSFDTSTRQYVVAVESTATDSTGQSTGADGDVTYVDCGRRNLIVVESTETSTSTRKRRSGLDDLSGKGSLTMSFGNLVTFSKGVAEAASGVASGGNEIMRQTTDLASGVTDHAAFMTKHVGMHDLMQAESSVARFVVRGAKKLNHGHALGIHKETKEEKLNARFLAEIQKVKRVMLQAIDTRCKEDDIINTCDAVLHASSNMFVSVYDAVWNLVCYTDEADIENYVAAISTIMPDDSLHAEQRTGDILDLYSDAVSVQTLFREVAEDFAHETGTKAELPPSLKHVSRILEKTLLAPGYGPEKGTRHVCDVVRGMLEAPSMAKVIAVIIEMSQSPDIRIVRVKDRFVANPSPGGWRDLMINFYFTSDPHRHVCEIQVVHSRMLVARKGLPGHAIYGRSRNALEILEKMEVAVPAMRTRKARQHLMIYKTAAKDVLRVGFKVTHLIEAGYTSEQILDAGVDQADLRAAMEEAGLGDGAVPLQGIKRFKNAAKSIEVINKLGGRLPSSVEGQGFGGGNIGALSTIEKLRKAIKKTATINAMGRSTGKSGRGRTAGSGRSENGSELGAAAATETASSLRTADPLVLGRTDVAGPTGSSSSSTREAVSGSLGATSGATSSAVMPKGGSAGAVAPEDGAWAVENFEEPAEGTGLESV